MSKKENTNERKLKERKQDEVSFFQPLGKDQTLIPVIPHFKGICPNC